MAIGSENLATTIGSENLAIGNCSENLAMPIGSESLAMTIGSENSVFVQRYGSRPPRSIDYPQERPDLVNSREIV